MSSNVAQFPPRPATSLRPLKSRMPSRPRHVSRSAKVLRFPAAPNSLTDAHCATLLAFAPTLIGDWTCDIDPDERRGRYATLSTGDHLDPRAFMVIRERGRFVLFNHLDDIVEDSADLDDILTSLASLLGTRRAA